MQVTSTLVALCWITFVAVWIASAAYFRRQAPAGHTRSRLPPRRIAFRVVGVAAVIAALGARHLARVTFGEPVRLLGVLVCAGGVAFAIWARMYLGASWGMPMSVRAQTTLVRSGPYRLVRHPIYSGMLVAMVGSALTTGLAWLPALVGVFIYFVWASRVEEADLTKVFPTEYPEYVRTTKRLVPFVY